MSPPDAFLAAHMVVHIVAMNAVAPLAALALRALPSRLTAGEIAVRRLPAALVLQLSLLWLWHLPAAMAAAMDAPGGMAAMHLSLFGAAVWFWLCILGAAQAGMWRALAALAVAAKLFCLLGILFVFAPSPIYATIAGVAATDVAGRQALLDDQHLAGLAMLIACPLSYGVAAIAIVLRWIGKTGDRQHRLSPTTGTPG